ncbi:putative ribonuclease H-like domain-containing protein [Tanacetum coccineum]
MLFPLPILGTSCPPKPDLVLADKDEYVFSESATSVPSAATSEVKTSVSKPKSVNEPLMEDWISDSENENETKSKSGQRKPSNAKVEFVKSYEHVKSPRDFNHLIKDCDFYEKKMVEKPVWNNARAVLMKSGFKTLNTARQKLFEVAGNYEEIDGGFVAFGGNPKGGKITGKGKIRTRKLDFEDVYFVKELKFNLFSVSQMCDKKNSVLFTDTECVVLSPDFKLLDESQVLLRVPRKNNMYSVDLKNVVPSGGLTCLFAKATLDESNLWHRRLGHINFKTMNKLVRGNLVRGLPSKIFENDHTCVACQKGKQHKASCKTKTVSSISQPLQMLNMDLFGQTFVKSIMKKMYYLVVTDGFSRFSWVFFLATKDETSGILKAFITRTENQINHKVIIIRCDNGTEFKNKEMNQFCEMKGIKREFSNRVLVIKPHNKTPYEPFNGRPPTISFIRPFGCPVTILNTLDHLGKFDGKADEGFFVGEWTRMAFDIDTLTKSMNYKPVVIGNQTNGNAGTKESIDAGQVGKKTVPSHEYILLPLWTPDSPISLRKEAEININNTNNVSAVSSPVNTVGTKDANVKNTNSIYTASPLVNFDGLSYFNANPQDDSKMPILEDTGIFGGAYDDEDFVVGGDMNNLESSMPVSPIATTRVHKDHPVEQIIRDLHSAPQIRRMTKNYEEHGLMSLIQKQRRTNHKDFQKYLFACFLSQVEPKKKVWTLVDLPYGKRAIGTKWVYMNKNDERGIIVRNKARLVAHGYTQVEGRDYDEVFAPVARIEAIRLFLAYVSFMNFVVYKRDVKSAFFYGKIEEEV